MGARSFRSFVILVWGVLLGAGSSSASDLAALLDAAGVSRHVAEWPEANASAREEAREALDEDAYALLLREVASAFAADAIVTRLEGSLRDRVAGDAVGPLAHSYATRGIASLLGADSQLAAADLREFPGFASDVSRQEVPAARFELVMRLDEASGFGRDSWATTLAWGAAIERGSRALGCAGPAAWRGPLSEKTLALREQLAQPFRERVNLELLFLVRGVDTRELRSAVELLESELPRSFQRQLSAALREALGAALQQVRSQLALAINERCR